MLDIIYYILYYIMYYIILCMHNHLKPEFDAGRDGSAGGRSWSTEILRKSVAGGGFYGGSQK